MDRLLEQADELLIIEEFTEMHNAIKAKKNRIIQRMEDFKENGLRIIGLELEGSPNNLKRVRDENSLVKAIEVQKRGIPQPAIFNQ